jgi:hypothetical protein
MLNIEEYRKNQSVITIFSIKQFKGKCIGVDIYILFQAKHCYTIIVQIQSPKNNKHMVVRNLN